MKALIALVLATAATLAGAEDPSWSVTTTDKATGKPAAYTVLPATVEYDAEGFVIVVIEYILDGKLVRRATASVSGCDQRQGAIQMFDTSGKGPQAVSPRLQWTLGGTRIFDNIAILTCVAAYKALETRKAPEAQAPTTPAPRAPRKARDVDV